MKVIATIQSKLPGEHPPVDMQWYSGDNTAQAMAAVATAIATADSDPEYTRTLAIRIEF
jgi:hypothetical protein